MFQPVGIEPAIVILRIFFRFHMYMIHLTPTRVTPRKHQLLFAYIYLPTLSFLSLPSLDCNTMSDAQAEAEKLGGDRSSYGSGEQQPAIFERPTGWRAIYYHPTAQVAILGFVCFMCPGMFNALTGLGGGGQLNATVQANANSALYATFAFFGFFSGYVGGCLCGHHGEWTVINCFSKARSTMPLAHG